MKTIPLRLKSSLFYNVRRLILLLAVCVALGAACLVGRHKHEQQLTRFIAELETASQRNIAQVATDIGGFRSDVLFLSRLPPIPGMIRAMQNNGFDASENEAVQTWQRRMQQIFAAFLQANHHYYQVCFIGVADGGRELVKVERRDGAVVISADGDLAQKSGSDYLRDASSLKAGQTYLSPFERNREQGESARPGMHTFRAVTPVFDAAGRLFGVVAVSLDADQLLSPLLDGMPADILGYVADEQGYYLLHPDVSRTYGFERGQAYRLQSDFPAIRLEAAGERTRLQTVVAEQGDLHVVARQFHFDSSRPERFLTVALALPESIVSAEVNAAVQTSYKIILAAALLVLVLIELTLNRLFKPLQKLARAAREIAEGCFDGKLPRSKDREVAELIAAFDAMLSQLRARERDLERRVEKRTAELKLNQHWLQSMANNIDGFVSIMLDPNGRIVSWNEGAQRLLGYCADDIIGQDLTCFFTPEDVAAGLPDSLLENARQYGSHEHEGWRLRKDGSRFYVDAIISAVRDEHNAIAGFIKVERDISERYLSEHRLKTIIQSAPIPLLMVNAEGEIVLANQRAERLFGYRDDELIGRPVEILMPARFQHAHVNKRDNYMDAPVSRPMGAGSELLGIRKDGVEFPLEVGLGALSVGNENLVIATISDITERKHSEALLIEAKRKSDAASQAKSDFLANMSHEIRTPMNAVIGLTQLTLDTELTPKQRDHLDKVYKSSQALLTILDDILDYSKIEAGKLKMEQLEFSLDEVLTATSDLFAAKIAGKSLELFVEIDPAIRRSLIGDPLRLGQVLNNLVGNAVKFTEQGEIHVRVDLLGGDEQRMNLRFAVRDTGIGMDKAQASGLFSAFSQADTSITRKYGGTGLGLAICKRLVGMMDGECTVSSALGKGSTFAFTASFGVGGAQAVSQLQHQLRAMRVLVVDDQETSLLILEHYLEAWQFDVTGSNSAADALELIYLAEREGRGYEVMLIDWKMPNMDGLALVNAIQAEVESGRIRYAPAVIMVTAYDKEALLRQAAEHAPFKSILIKPVTQTGLFHSLLQIQQPDVVRQITQQERRFDLLDMAAPIRGAHILLVEDNRINQEVARAILDKAGLRTTVANHGGEAVEYVGKQAFDAVLMDLQMPIMDGLMATRLIRALPQGKTVPIIALSAAAMLRDKQAGEQAGMNDHIAKPIDQQQLIATLVKYVQLPLAAGGVVSGRPGAGGPEPGRPLAHLAGFDLARARSRLNDNEALLIKLLRNFAEDYADATARLGQLLRERQTPEAAQLLHGLRGVCANLGALALADTARQLERQVLAGQALDALPMFREQLDAAVRAIQTQARGAGSPANDMVQGEPVFLAETLQRLTDSIERHQLPADDEYRQILQALSGHVPAHLLIQLERCLHDFDFTAAGKLMAEIIENSRIG